MTSALVVASRPEGRRIEMRIVIVGTGYVGLVSAACFARAGEHVACIDIDDKKISMLDRGEVPIYEPGLADAIIEGRSHKRLSFASDASAAEDAEIVFIAVGTPARASD